jgi:hypothetical protein
LNQSRPLNKEDIDLLLQQYQTKDKAREFLIDAGLIDEHGELTLPYQPEMTE